MFPFVFLDSARLGPFAAFGIFLALSFGIGDSVFLARAKALGFDERLMRHARTWMIGLGFVVGHLLEILFYHRAELAQNPWIVVLPWKGMSSLGGIVGAVLGAWCWSRFDVRREGFRVRLVRRVRPEPILPLSELVCSMYAIPFAIGRLGCALVHDHPGVLATPGSFLARLSVRWPIDETDGAHHVFGPVHVVLGSTLRYDLGLLEFLLLAIVAVTCMSLWRKRRPEGTFGALLALLYSPARFALDFLRTDEFGGEPRYLGLTFAQHTSIAFFLFGLWMLRRAFGHAAKCERDASMASPAGSRSRVC